MAEEVQQVKQIDAAGNTNVRTRKVVSDPTVQEPVARRTDTAARIVWFIAGVIITLLAIRFVLVLLGANQGNAFVHLIYNLSYPFAVPFFGMFSYELHYGVSRFELSTLVAMGVYALVAFGIARLLTIKRA